MSRFAELRTFVSVVEAGSITGAAERLEIAKSAVSRRLSELEARLGVQLLQRTTRRLSLTDSGRALYERSVRLLDDLEDAELEVSQRHCELAGRLRVAAPLSFGVRHLTPAIADFSARHPDIEFDLDVDDRHVDLIAEGFDLGIRIADLDDSNLIARRIAEVRHVVCASPSYLEAHGRPVAPADLAEHRCLVYGNVPQPERWRFENEDGSEGFVDVPISLRANSGDLLTELASAGGGIVMEPDFIVHRAVADGRLEVVLPDIAWPRLNVYAIYPPTRYLSRRVRELIDFLVERFASEPAWRLGA